MRIALLAPCWFSVPPVGYGGVETVVSSLADGLSNAGHEVTLFAAGGSHTRARLMPTSATPPSDRVGHTLPELLHAATCLERAGEFDLVNDHSGPLAAGLSSAVLTPLCHTVHRPLAGECEAIYDALARLTPRLRLIAIAAHQRRSKPDLPWLATCPNGLDLRRFPFRAQKEDYLLFLGRMAPYKGAARAARLARRRGLPLRIAGKIADREEREYFRDHVRPWLGGRVEYVGEVSHAEKVELLGRARATLFPVSWEEPFGMVMVESMACGTPVVGTRRGAVPEVVEHGRGGFVVDDDEDALLLAVEQLDTLDPADARSSVEERFSLDRMVAAYLAAYEALLASGTSPTVAT